MLASSSRAGHQRRGLPMSDPGRAPSDLTLVDRIRVGDAAAFESMFQAYYRTLCGFVFGYVRSREAAEEVVADIFLSIWERRASWSPAGSVRGYLLAAARNRALNVLRGERTRARWGVEWGRTVAADAAVAPGATSDATPGGGIGSPAAGRPDAALERQELAAALRLAVHELPERRRVVLTLRWQHGMSYAEIATVLGISVKGVEVQLARAIRSVRARLAAYKGDR